MTDSDVDYDDEEYELAAVTQTHELDPVDLIPDEEDLDGSERVYVPATWNEHDAVRQSPDWDAPEWERSPDTFADAPERREPLRVMPPAPAPPVCRSHPCDDPACDGPYCRWCARWLANHADDYATTGDLARAAAKQAKRRIDQRKRCRRPRKCLNCGSSQVLARHRCRPCYMYRRRNGTERPEELVRRAARRLFAKCKSPVPT